MRLVGLLLRRLTAVFSMSLLFSFQIATINGLSQGLECRKCDGFSYLGHFIFDAGENSTIELVSESVVVPSCNCREVIKLDKLLSDALSRFH